MTDHKFTDDDVIKALECCAYKSTCEECPYYQQGASCLDVEVDALDLINRQKAEIERLYKEIERISKMTVETNVKEMTEGENQ